MLSLSQMLSLDRMKPIVVPTEERVGKQQEHKSYLFKALGNQTVIRTHYQKMLLAAKKRVMQTGIAIKPEEWRLPKAPLPSRPDFSRCLYGKPRRNFPIDLKMFQPEDKQESGNEGYMDPILILVPNIQLVSFIPHLVPEQQEPPKFYTPFCNQKILHERQPQFIQSGQKDEDISEDENLTKANFEDYQQISLTEEMMEGVSEDSLERKEAIPIHSLVHPTGPISRVKQESDIWDVETNIPFGYQYSYVRLKSSPRIDQGRRRQKDCLQKGVRLAKSLRIWQHVPKCSRRDEKIQQSKIGQRNQLEVMGNPGTLFVKVKFD